jgi:CelD/BcsL family acetyltransferase involved in cellulose biosynthesis
MPQANDKPANPINLLNHPSGLRAEVVDSIAALEPYRDDWNRLALETPQKLPMLSHAWVSSYLENFLNPDETWCCIFAFDGDRLVGLLPVIITPFRILGLNRPRLATPFNLHTFSVDFLSAAERQNEIVPFLLTTLFKIQKASFGFAINRLPETTPTLDALANNIEGAGLIRDFAGYASIIKIEGAIDDFHKRLSRNFSRNLTKAHNKLAKLPNVKTVFLTGADATENELPLLMKVEASGWKKKEGTAIEQSPTLVSFYTALTKRLSALGWLEWHFLKTDGRVIAGQLGVKMGRTLALFKIGYDEEYSYCSPGNILFESVVERAYSQGDTDEINCITDMAWHDNWVMDKRPHYDLWIYPKHPIPFLFGALPRKARMRLGKISGLKTVYHHAKKLIAFSGRAAKAKKDD